MGSGNKRCLLTLWVYWPNAIECVGDKIKLLIKEALKSRLLLGITKKKYFETKAKISLPSSYLGLTILLYKYGHAYLTYLPQKFLSKLFFGKKYGWEIPYLPTIWTYVRNFVVFLECFPKWYFTNFKAFFRGIRIQIFFISILPL